MKIVVLDGYTLNPGDLSWDGFRNLGELTVYDKTGSRDIAVRAAGAEAVLTNKTPLDSRTLEGLLPHLKYVGVLATGYNVVDTGAALRLGMTVTNIPAYGTASVAQMTFALLLELCNHVWQHSDAVRSSRWVSSPHWCFWDYPLTELHGKTIGITGFGNIGRQTADIAGAFGMNILANDRRQDDQSHRKNFRWSGLNDIFRESDVLTLHCPLTPETEGLINRESLKLMKKTAFLINTSRGGLVVEDDLASALNNNMIAGAAVDVLSTEPPDASNPLLRAKNCIITPHISWATLEARKRLMDIAANNLKSFLDGQPVNTISA